MGDMRASNAQYALWPWPLMLDKGERVKLITPVDQGVLTVFGILKQTPDRLSGHDVKVTFDVSMNLIVRYKAAFSGEVISLYESDPHVDCVLGVESVTGIFTVNWQDKRTQFGLHFEDVKASEGKSNLLSDAARADGANVPGEPRT